LAALPAEHAFPNAFGVARQVDAGAFVGVARGVSALREGAQFDANAARAGESALADVGRCAPIAKLCVRERDARDGAGGVDDFALESVRRRTSVAGEGIAVVGREAQADLRRDDLASGTHVERAVAALVFAAGAPIGAAAQFVAGAFCAVEAARTVALRFTCFTRAGGTGRLAAGMYFGLGRVELRSASSIVGTVRLRLVVAIARRARRGAIRRIFDRQ